MKLFKIIKSGIQEIFGDAAATTLLIDLKISINDYNKSVKESGSAIGAIADGKFGYRPEFEKLLAKYGKTYRNRKTNEQISENTKTPLLATNKHAWLFDVVDAYLSRRAKAAEQNYEPQNFKEKIKRAEPIEAEVIEM